MDPRFRIWTLYYTAYKDETNPRSSLSCVIKLQEVLWTQQDVKGGVMHVVFTLVSFLKSLGIPMALSCCVHPPPTPPYGGSWNVWNREINKVEFPHGEKIAITRPLLCFQRATRTALSVENVCYETMAAKGTHGWRINCYRESFITLVNEHFYDGLSL